MQVICFILGVLHIRQVVCCL